MRIGVFGDSYAAGKSPTSWGSLLATMNDCVVENFAERGTSLFYSYLKFIENYDNFDVIIFLVTAPGRLYHEHITCPNFASAEYQLKNYPEDFMYKNHIKAASEYYLHLQNFKFDKVIHELMIEKIDTLARQHNKKLIMLPSLGESRNMEIMKYSGLEFFLDDINVEERKHFNVPDNGVYLERPTLQNHITDENNLIFAKLLTRIIKGEEIKIYKTEFNPCPNENADNCYDMDEVRKLLNMENK
jgi:hypothetical protein